MGRSAKPPERRQRRNRRPLQLVKDDTAIQNRTAPKPPKGVLRATANEWRELWSRLVSSAIMPEHFPALERLFLLKDERRRAYRSIRESEDGGRLAIGSQKQLVLNPLIRYIAELDGEIRQLEDRFGLTPRAGYSLGARYGEAVASLRDLNVGMEPDGPDEHEDDPRLHRDESE